MIESASPERQRCLHVVARIRYYDRCLTGVVFILHIIKFFQHLNVRAALFLFALLFVAWSNGYSLLFRTFLILMHSMKMADCDWTVLYYRGMLSWRWAVTVKWDGVRWEQSLAPCFTLIEPPLINGNCSSSWWFHTCNEAGVSTPGDRILATAVNNGGQGVSMQQSPIFMSLMDQKEQQVPVRHPSHRRNCHRNASSSAELPLGIHFRIFTRCLLLKLFLKICQVK